MKLSQVWAIEAPTVNMSSMSELQLLDMECGVFVENTVGKNPEELLLRLEELEGYLDDRYFAIVQMYLR